MVQISEMQNRINKKDVKFKDSKMSLSYISQQHEKQKRRNSEQNSSNSLAVPSIGDKSDPVLQEQIKIHDEVEEMRSQVEQIHGVNLNHLIQVVTPHVGVDITQGLVMPNYEYEYKLRVNRPNKMRKGLVQRLSYQNKSDMKKQAVVYQNYMENKVLKAEGKPQKPLKNYDLINPDAIKQRNEKQLLQEYSKVLDFCLYKHPRAIRVLIDAHKEKIYRINLKKQKIKKSQSQQVRTNDLLNQLNQLQKQEIIDKQVKILGIDKAEYNKRQAEVNQLVNRIMEESDNGVDNNDHKHDQDNEHHRAHCVSCSQKFRDEIIDKVKFEQRSIEGSEGHSSVNSYIKVQLPLEEQKLVLNATSKTIIGKKKMTYLENQRKDLYDKFDSRLTDFLLEIPKPPKPPSPLKADKIGFKDDSDSDAAVLKSDDDDQSKFSTLKFFYKFLRQKQRDAIVNADNLKADFFKQYIKYIEQVQYKIERFVQREVIKLKLLQNGAGILGGSEDSRINNQANQIKDMYNSIDYLILDNDMAKFKFSSYKADDLDCITDLPLSQLYIFREQMSKQQFLKKMGIAESFQFESDIESNSCCGGLRQPKEQQQRSFSKSSSNSQMYQFKVDPIADYLTLDDCLLNLKFFNSFGKETRLKLYKEFRYDFICRDQIIFQDHYMSQKQVMQQINQQRNQFADQNKRKQWKGKDFFDMPGMYPIYETELFKTRIYVLVSGHASLIYHEKATNVTYIERTLFPGDSIGDGPLSFDNKDGQSLKLVSMTDCDLISIDKELFKTILIKDFTQIDDLKDKMKALKNQILFANVTNYSLMILCNYVEIKEFHFGDIILAQDEVPDCFYIMLEGECKTVFETVVLKDKKLFDSQKPKTGELKKLKGNQSQNFTKGQYVNEKRFKSGITDYAQTKPPKFVKTSEKPPVGEADFYGMYRDNKHRFHNKNILTLSREVVLQLQNGTQSKSFQKLTSIEDGPLQSITHSIDGGVLQKKLTIRTLEQTAQVSSETADVKSQSEQLKEKTISRIILNLQENFPTVSKQKDNTSQQQEQEQRGFVKDYVAIKRPIEYIDGRILISAQGDRSTFDDFDWDFDIEGKSGLGSSFCQRTLLPEEPLKKQIHKMFDFYAHVIGGKEKVEQLFLQKQAEKAMMIETDIVETMGEKMNNIVKSVQEKQDNESNSPRDEEASQSSILMQQDSSLKQTDLLHRQSEKFKSENQSPLGHLARRQSMATGNRGALSKFFSQAAQNQFQQTIQKNSLQNSMKKGLNSIIKRNQTMQNVSLQKLMQQKSRSLEAARPPSSVRRPPDPISSVALECNKLVGGYNPRNISVVQPLKLETQGPMAISYNEVVLHEQVKKPTPLAELVPQDDELNQRAQQVLKSMNLKSSIKQQMRKSLQSSNFDLKSLLKVNQQPTFQMEDSSIIDKDEIKKGMQSKPSLGNFSYGLTKIKELNDQTKLSEKVMKEMDDDLLDLKPVPVKFQQNQKFNLPNLKNQGIMENSEGARSSSESDIELDLFEYQNQINQGMFSKNISNSKSSMSSIILRNKFLEKFKSQAKKSASQARKNKEKMESKAEVGNTGGDKDKVGEVKEETNQEESQKEEKVQIIFEQLMKSQFTVVANSRKVRVICMPPNALEYLSEPVRRQTRHKILDLFIPVDKKDTNDQDQKKIAPKPEPKKDETSEKNIANGSPITQQEFSEGQSKSSRTSITQQSKAEPLNENNSEKPEEEEELDHHESEDIKTDMSNTLINPHRYNYIDLVDRPFNTEHDLQNFISANQQWTNIKDYIYKYA